MDLRTGRTYSTVEDARAAGVPESDIAHVVITPEQQDIINAIPKVEFMKHQPFASFKNITTAQGDGDSGTAEELTAEEESADKPA